MKPAFATSSTSAVSSLSILGATALRSTAGLRSASTMEPARVPSQSPQPVASQLPRGRLVEFAAGYTHCPVTQAVACLRYAQHQGETCAWLQREGGSLFPPDLADSGIDLEALVVVHVPQHAPQHTYSGKRVNPSSASPLQKAAEMLLRSGGFGMLVLDLWDLPSRGRGGQRGFSTGSTAWQGRLLSLAREHHCWVVLLSPPQANTHVNTHDQGSLGPLVSIRLASQRTRPNIDPEAHTNTHSNTHSNTKAANQQINQQTNRGQFALHHEVLKDKSASLGALANEPRRGPWGVL